MRWMSALAALVLAVPAFAAEPPAPTLKDAYKADFLIGAALPPHYFDGSDPAGAALVARQVNSISPENVLKWGYVHPRPDGYAFALADRYVAFGQAHHMAVIGHNLVWHNQTPRWVFEDAQGRPLTREALLKRLHDHISTVVGRYKGRIFGWDVVNEALNDDGTLRQSPWLKIIGPDYIEKAYQYAHEADPSAELYYNDYSLERPDKRKGALALIARLGAEGLTVTGVGLQTHDWLDKPTLEATDEMISDFAKAGLKVSITELDIDMLPKVTHEPGAEVSLVVARRAGLDPYPNGLPDDLQQKEAERFAGLFGVFLKHKDVIERVTFWGVTDADSWLNKTPVAGRTNYPLVFDRKGQPKPAYFAVIRAAGG